MLDTIIDAQEKFGLLFEVPDLSFEINSKHVAGNANYKKNLIRINPAFLLAHTERVLSRTVPHEIAHLICHKLYPNAKQHHGPEFRKIMKELGCEDSTYHDMRLPN